MALPLTSGLLRAEGFRHGFFGRDGDHDAVAAALGLPPDRLFYLSQVHGTASRVLAGGDDRAEVRKEQGDITLSSAPDLACGVRVADCAPVLLAHPPSGAVAAVHSGWRGTVQGAAAAGVRALAELTRTTPGADVVAAVGPHIGPCCFEVGSDVAAELAGCSSLGAEVVDTSRARPHVDLRRVLEAQLRAAGVAAIDHVAGCTVCDAEHFHSFRRDGPDKSGRMLSAIVAKR
jgi:polyphenol oxidase